jgi:hypothetical protein
VRDEVIPEVKNPKLSSWDVAYALNVAIACLITYWIMTHTLSRFVNESSDFLGGMWAVVATIIGLLSRCNALLNLRDAVLLGWLYSRRDDLPAWITELYILRSETGRYLV